MTEKKDQKNSRISIQSKDSQTDKNFSQSTEIENRDDFITAKNSEFSKSMTEIPEKSQQNEHQEDKTLNVESTKDKNQSIHTNVSVFPTSEKFKEFESEKNFELYSRSKIRLDEQPLNSKIVSHSEIKTAEDQKSAIATEKKNSKVAELTALSSYHEKIKSESHGLDKENTQNSTFFTRNSGNKTAEEAVEEIFRSEQDENSDKNVSENNDVESKKPEAFDSKITTSASQIEEQQSPDQNNENLDVNSNILTQKNDEKSATALKTTDKINPSGSEADAKSESKKNVESLGEDGTVERSDAKTSEQTTGQNGDQKPVENSDAKTSEQTTGQNGDQKPVENSDAKTSEQTPGDQKPAENSGAKTNEQTPGQNGDQKPAERSDAKTNEQTTGQNGDQKPAERSDAKTNEQTTGQNGDQKQKVTAQKAENIAKISSNAAANQEQKTNPVLANTVSQNQNVKEKLISAPISTKSDAQNHQQTITQKQVDNKPNSAPIYTKTVTKAVEQKQATTNEQNNKPKTNNNEQVQNISEQNLQTLKRQQPPIPPKSLEEKNSLEDKKSLEEKNSLEGPKMKELNAKNMNYQKPIVTPVINTSKKDIETKKEEANDQTTKISNSVKNTVKNTVEDEQSAVIGTPVLEETAEIAQNTEVSEIKAPDNEQPERFEDMSAEKKQKTLDDFKANNSKRLRLQLIVLRILLAVVAVCIILCTCFLIISFAVSNDNKKYIENLNKLLKAQQTEKFLGDEKDKIIVIDCTKDEKRLLPLQLDTILARDLENILNNTVNDTLSVQISNTLNHKISKIKGISKIFGLKDDRKTFLSKSEPNFLVKIGIWMGIGSERTAYDDIFCKIFLTDQKTLGKIEHFLFWCNGQQLRVIRKHVNNGNLNFSSDIMNFQIQAYRILTILMKELSQPSPT